MPDDRPVKSDWPSALVVAGVVVLPLTVLGPAELFARNADEFSAAMAAVYARLLPVAAVAMAALTLLILALPRTARIWVVGVGLALGTALYVQSHFLVWDYGRFDGTGIDWDQHRWHGVVDVAVWACLTVFGAIARQPLARNALFLGGVLLAVQVMSAVLVVHANEVSWRHHGDGEGGEGIYELSAKRNVVVVVLDAFATPIFDQVIERRPDLAEEFTGFTYFRNAISVLPTTRMSIPAILTGSVYHNERPTDEYLDGVFARNSVIPKLRQRGYQSDLVTLARYCRRVEADTCQSPGELVSADRSSLRREETARLADLTLFRYLPQPGKRFVYSDERMLLTSWLVPAEHKINWHLSEALEAINLLTDRLHVGGNDGAFKLIHLMIPHYPYHLDHECRVLPEEKRQKRAGGQLFVEQGECAVRLTIRLLEKLRSLKAYDRSGIIVVSDHGFAPRKYYDSAQSFAREGVERAMALLMVKPPGAHGPMQTSAAPATNADVARTVADLLNVDTDLPGTSLVTLDEGAPRARSYYHYVWRGGWWGNDYLPRIQEYVLAGDPRDPAAWREGEEYPPGAARDE